MYRKHWTIPWYNPPYSRKAKVLENSKQSSSVSVVSFLVFFFLLLEEEEVASLLLLSVSAVFCAIISAKEALVAHVKKSARYGCV